MLRNLADTIARLLTVVFEKPQGSGEVSEDWELASVTPIYKKGKVHLGNYHTVSFTSIPRKVMEHLIPESIFIPRDDKKVIRSSHHGFTKGKSWLTSLIAF